PAENPLLRRAESAVCMGAHARNACPFRLARLEAGRRSFAGRGLRTESHFFREHIAAVYGRDGLFFDLRCPGPGVDRHEAGKCFLRHPRGDSGRFSVPYTNSNARGIAGDRPVLCPLLPMETRMGFWSRVDCRRPAVGRFYPSQLPQRHMVDLHGPDDVPVGTGIKAVSDARAARFCDGTPYRQALWFCRCVWVWRPQLRAIVRTRGLPCAAHGALPCLEAVAACRLQAGVFPSGNCRPWRSAVACPNPRNARCTLGPVVLSSPQRTAVDTTYQRRYRRLSLAAFVSSCLYWTPRALSF